MIEFAQPAAKKRADEGLLHQIVGVIASWRNHSGETVQRWVDLLDEIVVAPLRICCHRQL